MRLREITEPDPEHAELALQVADVYRKLYERPLEVLRSSPPRGAEVAARHHAIVFPIRELVGERTLTAQLARRKSYRRVRAFLERHGWRVDPAAYLAGHAVRRETTRLPDTPRVRRQGLEPGTAVERTVRRSIPDVLREIAERAEDPAERREAEELTRVFRSDPARRGAARFARDEPVIVVSFDPLETAHVSAGRPWQSCWRIGGAGERDLKSALSCGVATAWLTTRSDIEGGSWIDRPLARWLLVPYVAREDGEAVVALEPVVDRYHTYGDAPPWANRAVREATRRIGESLGEALGRREAVPKWEGPEAYVPPLVLTGGSRNRADRAAERLYTAARTGRWTELRAEDLLGVDTRELADALERIARTPGADPIAGAIAEVLREHVVPMSPNLAKAAIALAATGHLPRDVLPPPDMLPPHTANIALAGMRRHVARTIGDPENIWTGEDRTVAWLMRGLSGIGEVPDAMLPDREGAVRALRRIAGSSAVPPAMKDEARAALLALERDSVGGLAYGPGGGLAARVLQHDRGGVGRDDQRPAQ